MIFALSVDIYSQKVNLAYGSYDMGEPPLNGFNVHCTAYEDMRPGYVSYYMNHNIIYIV